MYQMIENWERILCLYVNWFIKEVLKTFCKVQILMSQLSSQIEVLSVKSIWNFKVNKEQGILFVLLWSYKTMFGNVLKTFSRCNQLPWRDHNVCFTKFYWRPCSIFTLPHTHQSSLWIPWPTYIKAIPEYLVQYFPWPMHIKAIYEYLVQYLPWSIHIKAIS